MYKSISSLSAFECDSPRSRRSASKTSRRKQATKVAMATGESRLGITMMSAEADKEPHVTPLPQEKEIVQETVILPDGLTLEQRIQGNRAKVLAADRRKEKIRLQNMKSKK
jgi:hypothetical protein